MKNKVKKIVNAVSKIVVVVVLIIAILLVGTRLIGYRSFVVLSGSMEPTYHVGSVIYVQNTPAEEIEVGDPITFVLDENLTVATHRVVAIDKARHEFTTKGDANDFEDGKPVHFNNLIGKPILTIPKLGYIVNYIQHPPGTYLALAFGALLVLFAFLPDLFDDEKKEKRKKEKKAE